MLAAMDKHHRPRNSRSHPRLHPHPKQAAAEPRLGIDIGRVLIAGDGPDTSFIGGSDDDAMRAPAMEGAFESVARLVARYEGRVWLVSKCGPRIQARSRRWLERHAFFETTGVRPDRLRFCRERREKAPICLELGITCFVDDRADVLAAMAGTVATRILFGAEVSRDPGVVPAPRWSDAEAIAREAADVLLLTRLTPLTRLTRDARDRQAARAR